MAAQSPLGLLSTRPLCVLKTTMSARGFKDEDPQDHDGWLRQDKSNVAERRTDDQSGPTSSYLPVPMPHGRRYGSTFPYNIALASQAQDRGVHAQPQQERHSHREREVDQQQGEPYGRQRYEGEQPPRRTMTSSSQYIPEHQRPADRGKWGEGAELRNQELRREESPVLTSRRPMPSLRSILQRSSGPFDRRDQDPAWRAREIRHEHHFERDEFASRRSIDDIRSFPARHDRQSFDSSPYDRQVPLPVLRRLPSLTERRSLSPASELRLSRASIASSRSSVSALARVASDMSMFDSSSRGTVTGGASRTHPISHDSPRATTYSPALTNLHNWSSPASANAAKSFATASPARLSRASSEEGDSGVRSEGERLETMTGSEETAPQRKKKKRKVRICTTPGCDKLVVDHGVCIRHGGGKRCNVEGCECRAQNKGLCWKHGGYTICQVDGCDKRAKSRGMCWSHGGGTQCKTEGCEKIAVSRGRCWAHGGGKRCKLSDCQKPAALRMDDYCAEHYAAHRAARANEASVRGGSDTRALYESWQ